MATWQQTAPHLRGPAHLPTRLGRRAGVQPPSAHRLGQGSAYRPSPLPPASNPGTIHHPLEVAEPYTPSGREYAAHAQAPYEYYTHAYRTCTHEPPPPPPQKNGPCRKDQHALGGKDSYQSISAWQQTTPTSPWYNPIHQSRWGGGPVHQRG